MNINEIATPAYVIDEKKLRENLEILKDVQDQSGGKILLAQKAYSAYQTYPIIAEYLAGTAASGIFEARLSHEEFKTKDGQTRENHVFEPAFKDEDMDEICQICDHLVFNSINQLEHHRNVWEKYVNEGTLSVGVRINPDISSDDAHDVYDPCAAGSRLGIRNEYMPKDLPDNVEGIHIHNLCEQGFEPLEETFLKVERDFHRFFPSPLIEEDYDSYVLKDLGLTKKTNESSHSQGSKEEDAKDDSEVIKRSKKDVRDIFSDAEEYDDEDYEDLDYDQDYDEEIELDNMEEDTEEIDNEFGLTDSVGKIKWINLGGGHHVTREDYDRDGLIRLIRYIRERYDIDVYLEPGEAIALDAGYLVTTVMDIVQTDRIPVLILDTSAVCHMPDVVEMPYRPPLKDSEQPGEMNYTYRLSSRTCLSGDIMGDYSFETEKNIGDRLFFEDMAIYSMVKNNTFNGMPLPDIDIMHENGEVEVIKHFGYQDYKSRL